ncbi:MFS transporter [Thermogymnomonas acidicola]|uniref:MFS transporter n=1 Tax=Thermogymnomonas acidicola TaxID=399579 RepID=A0AA37F9U5_9ARCH|nr:sugar porter family MFS transporter [Thermogymnomonas acidicola]GGM76356.1 MFS transporter [Thermogymnomonas acidicola]
MEQGKQVSIQDIMSRLDRTKATRFYWLLTLLSTIGGFLFGYDTSNIGTAMVFMPASYHSGALVEGYLVSGASLGAAIGALIAMALTDRYGRKSMLIFDAALYTVGAVLSAVTVDLAMLLISRTLIGLAVGADSAIATAYIAEYAPKGERGSLGILQQWMITVGILGAYLVGMATLFFAPGLAYTVDWRLMLGVAAIPSLIGLAFRFMMPESPRWLLLRGERKKALDALNKLGIQTSEQELSAVNIPEERKKFTLTKGMKRALLVAGLFMMFQQITGINIPFYYGPTVISSLHIFRAGSSVVYSQAYAVAASSILAVINVAATYIGFRLIDRLGRRSLALTGYIGMAVFGFVGTILLLEHILIGLLIAFAGFIIFFAFGVGGTGWIIQGEYFPTEVRGRLAGIVAFIDWIANFAIVEVFPLLRITIGLAYTEALFGILSVAAFIVFYFIMPMTKGKSVEEIAEMFEKGYSVRERA